MNPSIIKRRPFFVFMLVVALAGVGILTSLYMRGDLEASSWHVKEFIGEKFKRFFHQPQEEEEAEQTIIVTSPDVQDVTITESFVCQIHSQRHIEVRALEGGYLSRVLINEGQEVKQGDVMFKILATLYKARLDAETAKARLAALQYQYTQKLVKEKVVSENEASLREAELAEAQAKANLANAELDFTEIKAPFDGLVDRLLQREGSLVKEGDILTTLADNSVMWVYFNVPERYYLRYMANRKQREKEDRINLVLADGETFPYAGKIGTIEADFNNKNGNIKFRADYPNPNALLRNGQTGTIKVLRPLKNALVIPQRATFEILDKRYVWVVDSNDVVHQTLITVQYEQEDIFVIDSGITEKDKIVFEGIREVEDGSKVTYEFRTPKEALANQKFHAE